MKHKKAIIIGTFFLLGLTGLQAQESLTTTGGGVTGTGGTASYSVGQVAYTTHTGTTGTVSEGVQQAYEIYTLSVSATTLNISLSVYPNPTTDMLNLKVDKIDGLATQLYDMQGRLLESKAITSSITKINTSDFPSGAYLVKVVSGAEEIKTFKVIKN